MIDTDHHGSREEKEAWKSLFLPIVETGGEERWRGSQEIKKRGDSLEEKWIFLYIARLAEAIIRQEIVNGSNLNEVENPISYVNTCVLWLYKLLEKRLALYVSKRLREEFGLTDREIKQGMRTGWPVEIKDRRRILRPNSEIVFYGQLMTDPYIILDIPPDRLNEIAKKIGAFDSLSYVACLIVNRVVNLCRDGGHVCYPLKVLVEKVIDPLLSIHNVQRSMLSSRLRDNYWCEDRTGYIYIFFQTQIEDRLTELFERRDGVMVRSIGRRTLSTRRQTERGHTYVGSESGIDNNRTAWRR